MIVVQNNRITYQLLQMKENKTNASERDGLKVALEKLRLVAFDFTVLNCCVLQIHVEFHRLVRRCCVLILREKQKLLLLT